MKENTVIVVDTSNYQEVFAEQVPFKATIVEQEEDRVLVKSITTEKEYDLYPYQVLEALDIEEIINLLDLSKYGE